MSDWVFARRAQEECCRLLILDPENAGLIAYADWLNAEIRTHHLVRLNGQWWVIRFGD